MRPDISSENLTSLLGFLTTWSQLNIFWSIGVAVVTVLVNVVFAVAVYRDATRLGQGRSPIIVGPTMWCVATLLGGVITAGIYWALHHSRLNPAVPVSPTESHETEV